jgi:hypothetical protein
MGQGRVRVIHNFLTGVRIVGLEDCRGQKRLILILFLILFLFLDLFRMRNRNRMRMSSPRLRSATRY